jgi:hypothetical protein
MSLFAVTPELKIGSIVEVAGTSVRIELDGTIAELTRTYRGHVYPIGQFASVVKIHYGRVILVAYVRLLRMRSEIAKEQGVTPPPASEDSRVIEADLFGELVWNEPSATLEFRRGIKTYPLPGQAVHLTTNAELQKLYQGAEQSRKDGNSPMLDIGSYVGTSGTRCFANLDKLFGLHCAVLGSTGAGKSGTVAAILHSVLTHHPTKDSPAALRPRIILIDPHGEYAAAFKKRCVVYRAYDSPSEPPGQDLVQLKLPYWLMTGEEFREMVIGKTEYEATSENNIVYKALTHSRLVTRGWIEKSKTPQGSADANFDAADPRPLKQDDELKRKISGYNRDTPDPFSLDEFENHIRLEQGMRVKSGKWEPLAPTDFKPYASVLDKLAVLRTDPRLSFMMAEY